MIHLFKKKAQPKPGSRYSYQIQCLPCHSAFWLDNYTPLEFRTGQEAQAVIDRLKEIIIECGGTVPEDKFIIAQQITICEMALN